MGINLIEQHFRLMYPNWLQQAKRMCISYGKSLDPEDVLQEVLCGILQKKCNELETLCIKQEKGYKAIDCTVMNWLKLNIISEKAPYFQKYNWTQKKLAIDYDFDITELQLAAKETEPDFIEEIIQLLQKLHISQHKKDIFTYLYLEQRKFKEWPGPESDATLSRTCNYVIQCLRVEIKKYL